MAMAKARTTGARRHGVLGTVLVNGALALICILWLVPTLGLLISSFRERADIVASGWWTVLPHSEFVTSRQIQLTPGLPLDQPIQVEGVTVSDDQLREGYTLADGRKL